MKDNMIKKIAVKAAVGVAFAALFAFSASTAAAGNSDFYKDYSAGVWRITTPQGILDFKKTLDQYIGIVGQPFAETVVLDNDIDMSKISYSSITNFAGTFDGKGYKITGMTIQNPTANGIGFFAKISGATIKNVTFVNADITKGANSRSAVGVVAGYATATCTVENVHVKNSSISAYARIGGLVGMAEESADKKLDAKVTVKGCSIEATTLTGNLCVAGFCGFVQGTCDVSGSSLKDVGYTINGSSVVNFDTTVACTSSAGTTCPGKGTVVKGRYTAYYGTYYAAYADLYITAGDTSHKTCSLANGENLYRSTIVHDAPYEVDGVLYSDEDAIPSVAKVGEVEYKTLADAFAALSAENHTLTLLNDEAWPSATPVYWTAGAQSGYSVTFADALTAAYKANAGAIKIVCRPNADVGALTHGHVADDLTVYGNNAYLSAGECDLEIDTYQYSRTTGEKSDDGAYLEKDIAITAYELDNLGVWGQRNTGNTVTISLTDCDGKAIDEQTNVQRVYISGETGANNITLTDCDFLTEATAVYSNADGAIVVKNCTFADGQSPVNIEHTMDGEQTVSVEGCTFTNCGDAGDLAQVAAPIRLVNSGSGTMSATVSNTTITGTVGENGDILLGDGRTGQTSNDVSLKVTETAATVYAQKPGYYGSDGNTDATKAATETVTADDTLETSIEKMLPTVCAVVGDVEYSAVDAAMEAAAASETATTVKLLSNSEDTTIVPTWFLKGDVTIDADSAMTATFAPAANASDAPDDDGMAYIASSDAESVRTFTVGENVTLSFPETATKKGAVYLGYGSDGAAAPVNVVVNGSIEAYALNLGTGSSLTISKEGSLETTSGAFTVSEGANVTVEAGALITAKSVSNAGTLTVDATSLTEAVRVIDYTGTDAMTLADYGTVVVNGGVAYVEDGDLWVKIPVAQVGDTVYYSLADAFAAVQSGQTVKLLADVTETDAANAGIAYNMTGVTFDLNGHTYSQNESAHVFYGTGGVIKNGTMACLNDGSYALSVGSSEGATTSFTVEDVTMTGGISVGSATGVVLEDLTVTGTAASAVEVSASSSVTIKSGTYAAGNVAVLNGAAATPTPLTIEGGTFRTGDSKSLVGTGGVVPSITGGKFDTDVKDTDYLAEGLTTLDSESESLYVVAPENSELVTVNATTEAGATVTKTLHIAFAKAVVTKALEKAEVTNPESATAAQKTEALSAEDTNGNPAWVNIVAGIDSEKSVGVDAAQNGKTATIDVTPVNVEAGTTDDPGVQIAYQVDEVKVAASETGLATDEVKKAGEVVSDPAIDVDNVETSAYFQVKLLVRQNGSTLATVPATNYVGVLKKSTKMTKAIVPVPWHSLADGGNISVSNVVKTANLTAGDRLSVYDAAEKKYNVYTLQADKTWKPTDIYKIDANGQVSAETSGTPQTTLIPRGSGVWLERSVTSTPIVTYGLVSATKQTTEIAAATTADGTTTPTWSLAAVPLTESVTLTELAAPANAEKDTVIVPTEGAPRVYTVKDGAWGYNESVPVTDANGKVLGVRPRRKTDETLPAGTGFWYVNGGDAKSVAW